ncbi:MAG TPA: ABC transporter ATP-binding protein [Candidatus Dormibacteraeota bacterium]|nr:ABC transporter ATP-binding protein [Candidatus Dormibacteraeota bacterium]
MDAAPAGAPAIEVHRLVKRYGHEIAVDGISFTIGRGDFFGFLGPNGAGKTTTINAIVGLARIDAGRIAVFGHDVERDWRAARALIGLAPQEYNFDRYLRVREILFYQAGYYGLRPKQVATRVDALLERFGLADKAGAFPPQLSGGMKRRLTLARALVHDPQIVILDEPTAGVDVELRLELWETLRALRREGKTIVLTTHYLEEAEALCERIGIIEGGRMVALETTEQLLRSHAREGLTISLSRPLTVVPPELAALGARPDAEDACRLRFEGLSPARVGEVLALLTRSGMVVEAINTEHATLQDVFLELTKRGTR